jgi:ribonuclease T1
MAGSVGTEAAPKRPVSSRNSSRWMQVLCVLGVVAGAASMPAAARSGPDGLPTVSLAQLPREAQHTHRLVLSGGPFPYEKDGTVFGNRERLLPKHPRGFYREYTVRTPGAKNRGARRLVCGGEPPSQPEVCYYTADHYASFSRIVP